MSHKNHFKFSNKVEDEKNVVEESEVVEEEIQEPTEETETIESVESDEVVTTAGLAQVIESEPQEVVDATQGLLQVEEVIEEPTETTESVETVPEKTIGYVDGCDKLNVRKDSNKDSEIVCVIENSTELVIDLDRSTDEFYKVTTPAGVEGYCMKKFVMIPKSSE